MISNNICIGLAAHVDAGKTTLAESILYNTGAIRRAGRVDHGDSFLDNMSAERARGITIFAKQALFKLGQINYTLMDTPGHVDFLPEFGRVLPVLDMCVLIISAPDGVAPHDVRLWELLDRHRIPTIIFINKMDRAVYDKKESLRYIKEAFGGGTVDFSGFKAEPKDTGGDNYDCDRTGSGNVPGEMETAAAGNSADGGCSFTRAILPTDILEDIATLDEELMESYLDCGCIGLKDIRRLFDERKLIPCCFGSALKNTGIKEFLAVIESLAVPGDYPDETGALIYKTGRDARGRKIAYLRITGGRLRPRDEVVINRAAAGAQGTERGHGTGAGLIRIPWCAGAQGPGQADGPGMSPEAGYTVNTMRGKIDQVFIVNGGIIKQADEAVAGMAAAVTGLDEVKAGDGLGFETGIRYGYEEPDGGGCSGTGYGTYDCTDSGSTAGVGALYSGSEITGDYAGTTDRGGMLSGAYAYNTSGRDQGLSRMLRRIIVPEENTDPYRLYLKLKVLGEEFPETGPGYDNDNRAINISFNGPLQEEVFRGLVKERLGEDISYLDAEVFYDEIERQRLSEERLLFESLCADMAPEDDIDPGYGDDKKDAESGIGAAGAGSISRRKGKEEDFLGEGLARDRELEAIFRSTVGRNANKNKQKSGSGAAERRLMRETERLKRDMPFVSVPDPGERYLLVDGYNIIFAWEELGEIARQDINAARGMLADMMANYQGYRGMTLILVFDAYKVEGGTGSVVKYHNIYIVYTREAQTADAYIEKTVHELSKGRTITVATNDAMEQTIIFGEGAIRMSAGELKDDLIKCSEDIYRNFLSKKARLENRMDLDCAE